MSENNDLITCPHCGSQNPATFRFCSNCGEKLEEKQEEKNPVDAEPEAPVFEQVQGEIVSGGAFSSGQSTEETDTSKPEEEIHINYERAAGDPVPESAAAGKEGNGNIGFAIASLICGILSILCCCFVWLALILGIAGVVLGIITLTQKYEGKGMAIAGIITGGIGLLLFLIVLIAVGSTDALSTMMDALDEF